MIKLGSTDITNVMLGTTKVDAIFLGNTKVYPSLPVVEQDATTAWQLDISGGAYHTKAKRTLNAALPVIKLG